jgi:hypothetical protein
MTAAVKRHKEAGVTPRRIGRPMKPPTGKRAQLTVLVRADIKRAIDQAAQKSGRTQSQEAEHWLERLLVYEATLRQLQTDLAGMEKGNIEPVLWRRGYSPVRTIIDGKVWKLWAEPDFPLERSGFMP